MTKVPTDADLHIALLEAQALLRQLAADSWCMVPTWWLDKARAMLGEDA